MLGSLIFGSPPHKDYSSFLILDLIVRSNQAEVASEGMWLLIVLSVSRIWELAAEAP